MSEEIAPHPHVQAPASAHGTYLATKYFPVLDILRAIAITAVIWHHSASHGFMSAPATQGYQGVTLFFVISGYLIVTLILRDKDQGTFDLKTFFARRMARIWPAYYAVLATYIVVAFLLERDPAIKAQFFANVPAFATFTSNIFVDLSSAERIIFYFAWSLAAEQQFYLVWPWVELYLSKTKALYAAIGVVGAFSFFTALLPQNDPVLIPLVSFPVSIGLGVALAHVLHSPDGFGALAPLFHRRGAGLAAALALIATLSVHDRLGLWAAPLTNLAMAALVATCVVRSDNDLAWLCRYRLLVWIGTVSFGMYLWHMLALNAVKRLEGVVGYQSAGFEFFGGLILAAAIASLSYLTLERYFLTRVRAHPH